MEEHINTRKLSTRNRCPGKTRPHARVDRSDRGARKSWFQNPSEPQFPLQGSGEKSAPLVGLLGDCWFGPFRSRHSRIVLGAGELEEAGRITRSPRSCPCRGDGERRKAGWAGRVLGCVQF